MKKTFLLIAALLMMGSAAFAGGGFDFALGPKIGYQTATLSYKRANIRSDFSNHFTAGLFSRLTFGRVYVQPELLYFKTSSVFNFELTGQGYDNQLNIPTGAHVNLTLNQMNLQVPVLIGVNIIDLGIITLRAQMGPTANFVLSSRTLVDYTTIDGEQSGQQEATEDMEFDTKSIAWGMQAGLGIDVLKRITLDINYNFGLSHMFERLDDTAMGNYFDFTNIDDTKQNMFMVTLGIKFF